MDKKDKLKNNTLIAEFLGVSFDVSHNLGKLTRKNYYVLDGNDDSLFIQYDSNWVQLMKVVDKIESMGYGFICRKDGIHGFASYFETDVASIRILYSREAKEILACTGKTRLEATYAAVIDFISYFNAKPKTPGNSLKA